MAASAGVSPRTTPVRSSAERVTTVRLDWYDRRVLNFVLEWEPGSVPSDDATHVHFGIDSTRLMRRFDAILDAYARKALAASDDDEILLRRANGIAQTTARQGYR